MRNAGYVLAALAACWSASALAQNVNSGVGIGPSQSLTTQAPATPEVEHLLGDIGGVRTYLGNLGIDLTLDATMEFAGNFSGGTKQGATAANQIGVELDIDWQKLAGLNGFSTHAVVVNRSGQNDSTLFGDNLQPVQEIYGSGGDVAVHLVYIYGEEKLLGGQLDVAGGWMPVANDFAASTLYCNFMNNGLCGNPKDLPGGDIGFSSYPDAVLGARARVRPTPQTYLQVGVYQVNQALYTYPAYRSGFAFDTSQVHGTEIPVEAAWEPRFGGMPGHYKLGVGIDTTRYRDLYDGIDGLSTQHGNNLQFWALADQMLIRNGDGDDAGVIGLAGYVHSDPSTASYGDEVFVGLLDKGFWKARAQDAIGLLFTWQTVSSELTRVQELDREFGLPYANGATGPQTHEAAFEANYDIHVYRGVNFEPDFQYVFRPNAQGNIHDAAVLGFKAHITF